MTYRVSRISQNLMTKEEEVVLGRQVQAGIEAAEHLEINNGFNSLEKRKLKVAVRAGKDARDQFVERNIRLAMDVAAKYAKAQRALEYEDLIQESTIGLIRAVEKFDPSMGYKFSTYATWWCKQACQRAVANQSRSVRLPMHVEAEVRKLQKTVEDIEGEIGRMPTMVEVGERLGWSPDHCENLLGYLDVTKVSSLDDPISDDSALKREDVVVDASAEATEDEGMKRSMAEAVRDAVGILTDQERSVLFERHGIGNAEEPKTLQEIGELIGLTRERVRQLEAKGVSRLRHPSAGMVEAFGRD